MGHVKLILPGSYDFGETNAQFVKMAHAGLYGGDLRMFIKRAGHKMADAMRKLAFAPGEVPIHLIAIGATEYYGPNRNGDGFTERCCQTYHDTFVKHARWYRNHQNKDKSKSYGIIKHSAYNDVMHRLELIVALNGTKEAAKRNNGLVADRELEKLASGKEDWGVSMACKVAYDVCSSCGNKARTKDEYCTAETCKYGGCRDNLCKVAEDGHILYVDNPYPTWFDISDVYRPADRIAYVLGPMQKAAAGRVVSSAELAAYGGITAPFELEITNISDRKIREMLKLANSLAEIERDLIAGNSKIAYTIPMAKTQLEGLDTIEKLERPKVLKALAREKVALSLPDFVQFISGYDEGRAQALAHDVQPYLHGLFGNMCNDIEKLAEDLTHNPFRPSDTEPPAKWQQWARKQASSAALTHESMQRRAWTHAIRNEEISLDLRKPDLTKKAGIILDRGCTAEANEGLARAYGLYKLAFLYEIPESSSSFALTADLTVRQNYVS